MGIQFSDSVENIVGKGDIACYKQFLLFLQCFQKLSAVDAVEYLWSKGLSFRSGCTLIFQTILENILSLVSNNF